MTDKKFVFPRYQPESSKKNRWKVNKISYNRCDDVLYIEPFQTQNQGVKRGSTAKGAKLCHRWLSCSGLVISIIVVLVSIGCSYSIWLLSEIYFNYEQATNVIIQVKPTLKMTALSVCLYYPTILDQSHPMFRSLRTMDDTPKIGETEKKLTLKNIFDMTPKPEKVLSKCSYRLPNEFDLFKGKRKVCNEFFDVSKYYTVQYICYRFSPKKTADMPYSFLTVRYSLIDPGLFYQVAMDKRLFENATELQPSTYNWNGYPKSRFSTVIKNSPKANKNKMNETLSHYYLSYYKIRNKLLPAPFETNCINYTLETSFLEKSDCFDHCMRNLTIQQLDKLPFAVMTNQDIPLKMVTSSDFENSTFESLYRSFETHCAKKVCTKNDCRQLMYVTTFIRREWTSSGLVFRVDTPQSPDLVTVFEPKIDLYEYVIDVCNCISDWYGWSFMDITKISRLPGIIKSFL